MNICPCCHQETPLRGVLLASGTVTRAGKSADLTPHEAAILGALLKRTPEYVKTAKIINTLYGAEDGPENENNVLAVLTARMRKKILPLGLTIRSRYGLGYRLEVAG